MRNMISIWHTMQNTFFFFQRFLACFPGCSFVCCWRCTVTCFRFHLPPFSSLPVFPLFWDGPNYSPLMCGWTLWQYQEASHSLSLTHMLLQPFIMSLLCISDLHPFTSYYSSTTKADFFPHSLSLSIEFVQLDHPFHLHIPDINRHLLLLYLVFILSMYYSSKSVNESHLIWNEFCYINHIAIY